MNAGTVLVVGATGMLGQPVARRLNRDGYRVRALVRDAGRGRAALGDDIEQVTGDVSDEAALGRALQQGASAVHISLKAGPGAGEPERVEARGVARRRGGTGRDRTDHLSVGLLRDARACGWQ